jgi:long-chain acyl-CoA synthetase
MTSSPHLGGLAERWVARQGDYPAIWFEGRWHSSGELLKRAGRMASGLLELGLEPGDRVVVTMQNAPEVPILYHAVWRAGGIVTPAMHLLSVEDLRHVVSDSGARFVIAGADLAEKARAAADGLEHVQAVLDIGTKSLESDAEAAIADRAPDDLAALLYTGGTTGRSKGVMLSHRNLAYAGRIAAECESGLDLGCELMTLPMSHSFGMVVTLTAAHTDVPKSWVLLRRFDAAAVIELVQEHRVNTMAVVPSMLQLLLAEPLEDYNLDSLTVIGCGGAPLPPEVVQEFERRVPSASILEGYGLTETSTICTANLGAEDRRIGSVGPALPGVELKVVDGAGRPLAAGDAGEICCRAPSVMSGYWNAPDLTAEALEEGWLHTGDVGYIDADGYVFILDRKKDLIIRGGFNVYPRDVEDALVEHPAIQMAAVIGKPNPLHGEEVTAFVSLAPGASASADELVSWSRERIGGYKYPREVHVVKSMPLTGVGKVDRKALRGLLVDAGW